MSHKHGKDITSAKIAQIQRSSTESRTSSMKIPESQCAAREMNMSDATIRKIVAEDIRYRSYVLRRGQFMTQQTKERRFEKAKKLLAKLNNTTERKPLIFFFDEKNFQQENADKVPIVMKTKYPATVMVLCVVSKECNIMTPHFFKQGLEVNADAYLDVLQNGVVPWM